LPMESMQSVLLGDMNALLKKPLSPKRRASFFVAESTNFRHYFSLSVT
jgi:hypothetical protein